MMLRVFVAGATGTIGVPLVRALVARGHQVSALTRSPGKCDDLSALGVQAVVADALDHVALVSVVAAARPTHVIHQLTALPKDGPSRARDVAATNRLRIDGTAHLLDAAITAGARRFIVGSFALLAPRGPAGPDPEPEAVAAVRSMERQVLAATRRGAIEGVILRYGMFYGLEAPSTVSLIDRVRRRRVPVIDGDTGRLPLIHVEDAVSATVLALDAAPAGAIYEIVDDRAVSLREMVETVAEYTGAAPPRRVPAWLLRLVAPYVSRMTSVRLQLSNADARAALGWQPRYSTFRDGVSHMLSQGPVGHPRGR